MAAATGPTGVRVEQATPALWDDVVQVFGTRGDPSWCWCQFFVTTGEGYLRATDTNREALHDGLRRDELRPAGLLAYVDDAPVGWLQVGPRPSFPRVTTHRTTRPIGDPDDESIWRTACFVVKVGHRRQGVAAALLDAAIPFARDHGAAVLEGHPVDVAERGGKVPGANLYHGPLSTFLAAGFTVVARPTPARPVVRLTL